MTVSPKNVRIEGEYELTPEDARRYIDDHLSARIWAAGEEHVISLPGPLASCCDLSVWEEIEAEYRLAGWEVHLSVTGQTADSLRSAKLRFLLKKR